MTTGTEVTVIEPVRVDLGVIRADRPGQLVELATEAADALAKVIKAKKLFSSIQGKEYVRVEGWTTLATMMGCLPREVTMTRDEKGTYTATVELVRIADGQVLTRASAECGMDESTWKARADYARRSMAATRAVSKACRLAFSWVMVLAGYEATPSEEIPPEETKQAGHGGTSTAPAKGGAAPASRSAAPVAPLREPEAGPLSERPRALDEKSDLDAPTWPFGSERGRMLKSYDSEALMAKRNWLVKKSRNPTEFADLIQHIDDTLAGRGGE